MFWYGYSFQHQGKSCWITLILSALAPGRHSAQTLTMASCSAMARAVRQLSPVTRWTARPRLASAATTPRASGFSGSVTASTARMLPLTATMMHVQQLACRQSRAGQGAVHAGYVSDSASAIHARPAIAPGLPLQDKDILCITMAALPVSCGCLWEAEFQRQGCSALHSSDGA